MRNYSVPREKVVLAGLITPDMDKSLFEEDMHEMEQLCTTAGATVVATFRQHRERIATGTYLGWGKLKEIKAMMQSNGATTLVIDAHLAPGQIKTIENTVRGKVIDRGQLILDIFAMHARTAEARLQVELAQLRTLYPRLTHAWTHFSQQVGGIGTLGPGEKQLEVDRRLVQNKITDLKRKLSKIEDGRTIQRGGRDAIFKAALIGYTNVGKSSLFNALCNSSAAVDDKLFATLDTATRRAWIPGAGIIVVSDTVGLLRKLPHHLVASFRSTLGEVSEAHLLLLVMDASSVWIEQQMKTVEQVLADLQAESIARLVIFNKIDLVDDPFRRKQLSIAWPDALFVSAFNKDDVALMKSAVAEAVVRFTNERRRDDLILRTTKIVINDDR
ncbi:MAG: GTPase HflX [Chitinispirillaceae bacterium]|nr:GTPase HflX [Chitinispirillaceae bacterium]